ncbi:MAG: DUF4199 domain-containing protein [Flavobacteriaceae bacterium]
MNSSSLTPKATILQYGTLLGGISVVFGLMIYFLDMHYTQENTVSYVSIAITVGVIALAQYNFRKENEGYLSLGEGLKIGVGIALISGIIGSLYQVVLVTVIDPETIAKMLEIASDKIMDSYPEMQQEQLDQTIAMQKKFMTPGMMFAFGIIGSLFIGFVVALISGLILKRNRPE